MAHGDTRLRAGSQGARAIGPAFTGSPGEACTIKSCAVLITSLEFLSCFAMALSQTDGTSKAGMKEESEY